MTLKNELQNIISGNEQVRFGKNIQATLTYLRTKKKTISGIEKTKFFKKQETELLIEYIDSQNLWTKDFDFSTYIGEGAEQKIYESEDKTHILKINDSIFYAFWEDYFISILLHNFFFPHLAYEMKGFILQDEILYCVVKQIFVTSTETTDLNNVKEFMASNGFINKKENDYYNPVLGIILEDLHDENVLTENGILQFIDTVFYLMPSFYDKLN